mgnify:FL=1
MCILLIVVTYFSMYQNYFYDSFPLLLYNNTIDKKEVQFFFMYSTLAQGRALKRNHLNRLTRKKALLIDCFTNVTTHFLNNKAYRSTLEHLHLWDESTPYLRNSANLLYEYTMQPKQPLCSQINAYVHRLLQRVMIGIQVRIGGRSVFYNDKRFLQKEDLPQFIDAVSSFMADRRLALSDVYVFLSTDNADVVRFFQEKYGESLVMVSEYAIGHSAPKKNRSGGVKMAEFTKRAIMDLLILQRADYLIVTKGSSYGSLATRLQQNRNSPVAVDDFVDWSNRPDHCTVFERSDRPYLAKVIAPMTVTSSA